VAATYVQQVGPGAAASAKSATVTMAVTSATTAGNAIIVVCSDSLSNSMSIQSCTDTKGNTYTLVVNNIHSTAFVQQAIFIARNSVALSTSDTITVTASTANGQPAATAFEFAGVSGDSDAVTTGQGNSVTTFDTGQTAIPAGSHLLFSVATGTGARAFTSTGLGTWIQLPSPPNPSANIRTLTPWYQLVSGGGTLQNLGTIDASTNSMSSAAAFPAASSGSTNVTVTGVPATAAAAAPAGSVSAARSVAVTAPAATASAAAPAGTVATTRAVTVAGPVATVTASAPAGTVAATRTVTVAGPVAGAAAVAPAGTVATVRAVIVAGPAAAATVAAPAGTVTARKTVALAGPVATASAVAPAGSFVTAGGVTLSAPAATVTVSAPAGTVHADRSITLAGPLATATALALAGTVQASAVLAGPLATVTAVAPRGSFGSLPLNPHKYAHATLAGNGIAVAVLTSNGTATTVLAATGQATATLVAPLATVTLHTED